MKNKSKRRLFSLCFRIPVIHNALDEHRLYVALHLVPNGVYSDGWGL